MTLKELIASEPENASRSDAEVLAWLMEFIKVRSSDVLIGERLICDRVGMVDGERILSAIESSERIPDRVKSWLKPSEGGVELYNDDTLAALQGEVMAYEATSGAQGIPQELVDKLLDAFEQPMPRYQSERLEAYGDDASWLYHIGQAR